jgi:hypothetical protein
VNKDYFGRGEDFIDTPLGRITNFGELRTQGVYFDFSYSFTDKLGFTASIPFLAPKYTAPPPTEVVNALLAPHVFPDGSIPLDDGRYHGSFQDFTFRFRYNLTHPFMITPYVEYGLPSHDYLIYSHAIVGRNVKSLGVGVYLGGTLDQVLPNSYIQGRYGYAFDEKVLGISRGRNLMEMEFGYFFTPSIKGFTILASQVTNGGLDAPYDLGPPDPVNPLFFHHTQITRDNNLDIGFGGQYSINDRFDVFGLISHMITARNSHGLKYGINVGMSWGFGGSPQRPCHC